MNFTKQNLFFCFTVVFFAPLCMAMGDDFALNASKNFVKSSVNLKEGMVKVGVAVNSAGTSVKDGMVTVGNSVGSAGTSVKDGMENLGLNTWLDMKKTGIAIIACAKATYTYGCAVVIAHPVVAGTVAVVGLSYGGYRLYRSDVAQRAALALKESAQKIAEENARVAREVMARELLIREKDAEAARKIMEENARVALEILQRSAKIKNIVIITATVTVAGIGLGYAGYRLYRSIKEHRQQEKQVQKLLQQERDLSGAKQTLLDAMVVNAHNEVGLFGLPEGCGQAAGSLLVFPGGPQAVEEIVRVLQRQGAQAVTL
jgi:hypothetical protein